MITADKITEIFCMLDAFCKYLNAELIKRLHILGFQTKKVSGRETAKGKCSKAKSCPSCCATILALSAVSYSEQPFNQ